MRTTGDVAETEALAAGVDELMNRIADRARTDDPSRVAVLTALHLADKLRSLERRAADLEKRALSLKLRGEQAERRVEELREQAQQVRRGLGYKRRELALSVTIPGAVLTGDGRLLNYDTENWAPWEPYIGSNERLACLLEDNDHQT